MTVSAAGPILPARSSADALDALRDCGLRASSARRIVLEELFAADGPVSAERLADGLGGRFTRSDLASVYRNLETLEEHGLVRHFHVGHGPGLYAPADAEHEYLACEACGAVRTLESRELNEVRDYLRLRFGFAAGFGHFPVVGRCASCAPEEGDR